MDNKIEEQKEKDLIAGRIIDEFRKHSSNIEDWHKIAASKIHSQWKEYFTKQGYQTAMEDKLNEFKTQLISKIQDNMQQEKYVLSQSKGYGINDIRQCRMIVNCSNNIIDIINTLPTPPIQKPTNQIK